VNKSAAKSFWTPCGAIDQGKNFHFHGSFPFVTPTYVLVNDSTTRGLASYLRIL
jgi:hypothetical protein